MKIRTTFGIDMGDRKHSICKLNHEGEVIASDWVGNTAIALRNYFKAEPESLIALEAGTHSTWVSDLLEDMGHEVLVGNPRKLRAIWASDQKTDVRDAEMLARIARLDPSLLYPIKHRNRSAQLDLVHLKARDILVKSRNMQIAHVRSTAKIFGERIGSCSTVSFSKRAQKDLSEELLHILNPLLESINEISEQIRLYEKQIEELCKEKYPETSYLQQVGGVGPITSLTYVLVIEDPTRFKKSRDVGAFLGLCPRRDQSGETDKQLRITKAGNAQLRRLLVESAQYILGHFGADCDLREFGLKIADRGGKNAKRRAVVAVARKLAVLLHRLWADQLVYEPNFKAGNNKQAAVAA